MTQPASLTLNMYQDQDFVDSLALQNSDMTIIDLTGFTAHMQARADVTDALPVLDWSTAAGELVIDGPTGTITFAVPAATTGLIPTNNEFVSLVYDLILTASGGQAERLVQGVLNISPSVTRV